MSEGINKHFLITTVVVVLILFTGLLHAQDFDCTPLSCTIKDAGNYKVEMAGCRNTLDVYLYDKNFKPVRGTAITGFVEFFYSTDPPLRSPLVQYHLSNAFSAKILAPGFNHCWVILVIDGESVAARFFNECNLVGVVPQYTVELYNETKDIRHQGVR